jgi:hypothetical protein
LGRAALSPAEIACRLIRPKAEYAVVGNVVANANEYLGYDPRIDITVSERGLRRRLAVSRRFSVTWAGKTYYWEYLGRLDLIDCAEEWKQKRARYERWFPGPIGYPRKRALS